MNLEELDSNNVQHDPSEGKNKIFPCKVIILYEHSVYTFIVTRILSH